SLINLFQVIETANFVTMGLSAACCAVLYLVKEFINPLVKKKFKVPLPIELLIIIITLLASEFSNMSSNLGVVIVGEVPRGLPVPIIPDLGFLPTVFPSAIPVGIVGGVVTMSLAKMYCLEFQYSYDFNEDFAILGVSSLVSSFFQCFFACGALARNSVVVSVSLRRPSNWGSGRLLVAQQLGIWEAGPSNWDLGGWPSNRDLEAGGPSNWGSGRLAQQLRMLAQGSGRLVASNWGSGRLPATEDLGGWPSNWGSGRLVGMKSQISSLISCSGMLLVLLAIGPYFRSIPTCVLGSIIVVSLINVIKQVTELPQIWRISRIDFSVWLVAALSVLILDVTLGLAIGLGFTLFSVVLRTQSPRIAVLGRIGDTDIYRNVRVYAAAEELPGLKIVRFDAPLNFANAERFQDFVLQLAHEARRPTEAEPVGRVEAEHPESDEATAVHTFVLDCSSWVSVDMVGTYQRLKKQGYRVLFARCKESVRLHLHLHDFYKHADRSLFFISLHDAVLYASNVPPISQDEISSSSEHVNEAIEIEGEEGMPATNLVTMDTNL
uniref:STAS domain-containing protein n=1 Tax=Macrostomum lignano TaxID=282301 RepID=A0A1I8FTQ2_9PLAT